MRRSYPRQTATILIVDDSKTYLHALSRLLKDDYRLLVANNGPRALQIAAGENKPDLILLDVMMPEMDGYEVCRRLKANPRTENIPVIFVTGRDAAEDEEEGFSLGAEDYIPKPFHPAIVKARVRVQIERKHALAALELLLNNIEIQIWYLQDAETYGAVNKAHAIFMGREKKEVEYKKITEFLPEKEARTVVRKNMHVFVDKKQIKREEKVKNARGEIRLLEVTYTPSLSPGGELDYVVCSAIDITEQKQAEEDLANYAVEMSLKRMEMEDLYNKLDAEIDKARRIHRTILPERLPQPEGYSIYAYNRSAENIGGDFYDVIEMDDKLFFYLSDVSGHGLDGAMLSVFVKNTISDYLTLQGAENFHPSDMLYYLTRKFQRDKYPDDYFICLFIAVLNLKTGELIYSGAAFQTQPLVVINDEFRVLEVAGLPVTGSIPLEIISYQDQSITLTPGSSLFVSTDGLAEQEYGEVQYEQRLQELFRHNHSMKPDDFIEYLKKDFRLFNGNSDQADDDITCLFLKANNNGNQ